MADEDEILRCAQDDNRGMPGGAVEEGMLRCAEDDNWENAFALPERGRKVRPCRPERAPVMLSAAKHLSRWAEMLRCAQHDKRGMTIGESRQQENRGQQADASLRSG